jgi:hypothetical protein
MPKSEISFLPFHAINEFMTAEFRQEVVRQVLSAAPEHTGAHTATLNQIVRRSVKIPGFRQSDKAPVVVKTRPVAREFEHNPDLVAAVLALWAEVFAGLRQEVYDCLADAGWELLPPAADRTQLPGFLPSWPAGQDFDSIYAAYQARFPHSQTNQNQVSLMAVWLSGRLPYPNAEAENEQP